MLAASTLPEWFIVELLLILTAGLVASVVCRRLGVSSIVGYLAIGAVLGSGLFGAVGRDGHEVELLAEAGVFLLLFTVGLEFSLGELRTLAWRLPVGGALQMTLVAAPVLLAGRWMGLSWAGAAMLAAAASFSSTVLVFKTLAELGQAATPHGRRAIGVLLFQDVALVPLLLAVPLLTGGQTQGAVDNPVELLLLAAKAVGFVAAVVVLRRVLAGWLVPLLAGYRSPELVVLLTVVVLGVTTLAAAAAGLRPELGAFAAGLCFGGNRWSPQIDALVLPFRETFAAIFFVGLGLLVDVQMLLAAPVTLLAATAVVIAVKAAAAAIAVRATGLSGAASLGVGLGLAHVGEFAFVLARVTADSGLIGPADYSRFATVAFLSLLVTPPLLRLGLRLVGGAGGDDLPPGGGAGGPACAVVMGAGPVGKQVASL
ncbi:MAG: cation:proton antiporter, partial [Planctomycetota bacterium]